MSEAPQAKKNALDLFIEGARQGWNIGIGSMLPNVLMAFVIIHILNLTGLLDFIGKAAAPIMALWGLPGEGLVVLLTAFMSMGGAAGAAAVLFTNGNLSAAHVATLAPAIMLVGSLIQYIGRCLGTADANRRYWGWHFLASIINAMLGMWIMRIAILLFS